MGKIAAIELLGNVTLTEVLNSAKGSELLEKHGRWSIMKTAGRVDRNRLGVFFFAARDDGLCIVAGRTLMSVTDAIRFEHNRPTGGGGKTETDIAEETRRTAEDAVDTYFGKSFEKASENSRHDTDDED